MTAELRYTSGGPVVAPSQADLRRLTQWPEAIGYGGTVSNQDIATRKLRVQPCTVNFHTVMGVYSVLADGEQRDWALDQFEHPEERKCAFLRLTMMYGQVLRLLWSSVLGVVVEEEAP